MNRLNYPARCGAITSAAGVMLCAMTSGLAGESTPAIVFQHSGVESFMPSDKDAALRDAVSMLSERLREIPNEVRLMANDPGAIMAMNIADQIIPMMCAQFEYPAEWAVYHNGENEFGIPDIDARAMIFTADQELAESMKNDLTGVLRAAMPNLLLRPSSADPNLLELGTPFFNLLYGPVEATGDFVIGIDLGGDGLVTTRAELDAPGELNGSDPVYQVHIDGRALGDVMEIIAGMVPDPTAKTLVQQFLDAMPEDNIMLDVAGAFVRDEHVSVTRITNLMTLIELIDPSMRVAAESVAYLDRNDFRMLPVDARISYLGNQDVGMIVDSMIAQAEANSQGQFDPEEIFAQVESEIGLHPIDDLVAHLGDRWGMYASPSSGGGGLFSLVFFNSGINADGLNGTFEHLRAMANEQAATQAMGYARLDAWDSEGMGDGFVAGWTLKFPGLPVPLEVSFALTEDHLVAGLTPQAARFAVAQATGEVESSVLDNPRFRDLMTDWPENLADLSFTDTPMELDRGYAITQMLGSAISNFVRSPNDPSRDPGPIVPPYHELADGAKAWMQYSYMEGEDYVQMTRTDPSWLVNIAGTCGALGITPELIGATAIGAAIGANAN